MSDPRPVLTDYLAAKVGDLVSYHSILPIGKFYSSIGKGQDDRCDMPTMTFARWNVAGSIWERIE